MSVITVPLLPLPSIVTKFPILVIIYTMTLTTEIDLSSAKLSARDEWGQSVD